MTLPAKCKRAAAALAAAVLLAACAPGGSVSSPAGSTQAASGWAQEGAHALRLAGSDTLLALNLSLDFPTALGPEGAYVSSALYEPNDIRYDTFLRWDALEQEVLCAVPGCAHDTDACPARHSMQEEALVFFAADGVRLWRRPESGDIAVYRMALDGCGQAQKMRTVPASDAQAQMMIPVFTPGYSSPAVFSDGEALYYVNTAYGADSQHLVRLDLATGEAESVLSLGEGRWYPLPIEPVDGAIVCWRSKPNEQGGYQLDSWNQGEYWLLRPGEKALSWEMPSGCWELGAGGTRCYYLDQQTGSVLAHDFAAGTDLPVGEGLLDALTARAAAAGDEYWLSQLDADAFFRDPAGNIVSLVQNWYSPLQFFETGDGLALHFRLPGMARTEALLWDGRTLAELPLQMYLPDGQMTPVPVLAKTPQGLLVCCEMRAIGGADGSGPPLPVFALLEEEDYLAGEPNYRTFRLPL